MSIENSESDKVAVISDNILLEGLRMGDIASFETFFYWYFVRVYGQDGGQPEP